MVNDRNTLKLLTLREHFEETRKKKRLSKAENKWLSQFKSDSILKAAINIFNTGIEEHSNYQKNASIDQTLTKKISDEINATKEKMMQTQAAADIAAYAAANTKFHLLANTNGFLSRCQQSFANPGYWEFIKLCVLKEYLDDKQKTLLERQRNLLQQIAKENSQIFAPVKETIRDLISNSSQLERKDSEFAQESAEYQKRFGTFHSNLIEKLGEIQIALTQNPNANIDLQSYFSDDKISLIKELESNTDIAKKISQIEILEEEWKNSTPFSLFTSTNLHEYYDYVIGGIKESLNVIIDQMTKIRKIDDNLVAKIKNIAAEQDIETLLTKIKPENELEKIAWLEVINHSLALNRLETQVLTEMYKRLALASKSTGNIQYCDTIATAYTEVHALASAQLCNIIEVGADKPRYNTGNNAITILSRTDLTPELVSLFKEHIETHTKKFHDEKQYRLSEITFFSLPSNWSYYKELNGEDKKLADDPIIRQTVNTFNERLNDAKSFAGKLIGGKFLFSNIDDTGHPVWLLGVKQQLDAVSDRTRTIKRNSAFEETVLKTILSYKNEYQQEMVETAKRIKEKTNKYIEDFIINLAHGNIITQTEYNALFAKIKNAAKLIQNQIDISYDPVAFFQAEFARLISYKLMNNNLNDNDITNATYIFGGFPGLLIDDKKDIRTKIETYLNDKKNVIKNSKATNTPIISGKNDHQNVKEIAAGLFSLQAKKPDSILEEKQETKVLENIANNYVYFMRKKDVQPPADIITLKEKNINSRNKNTPIRIPTFNIDGNKVQFDDFYPGNLSLKTERAKFFDENRLELVRRINSFYKFITASLEDGYMTLSNVNLNTSLKIIAELEKSIEDDINKINARWKRSGTGLSNWLDEKVFHDKSYAMQTKWRESLNKIKNQVQKQKDLIFAAALDINKAWEFACTTDKHGQSVLDIKRINTIRNNLLVLMDSETDESRKKAHLAFLKEFNEKCLQTYFIPLLEGKIQYPSLPKNEEERDNLIKNFYAIFRDLKETHGNNEQVRNAYKTYLTKRLSIIASKTDTSILDAYLRSSDYLLDQALFSAAKKRSYQNIDADIFQAFTTSYKDKEWNPALAHLIEATIDSNELDSIMDCDQYRLKRIRELFHSTGNKQQTEEQFEQFVRIIEMHEKHDVFPLLNTKAAINELDRLVSNEADQSWTEAREFLIEALPIDAESKKKYLQKFRSHWLLDVLKGEFSEQAGENIEFVLREKLQDMTKIDDAKERAETFIAFFGKEKIDDFIIQMNVNIDNLSKVIVSPHSLETLKQPVNDIESASDEVKDLIQRVSVLGKDVARLLHDVKEYDTNALEESLAADFAEKQKKLADTEKAKIDLNVLTKAFHYGLHSETDHEHAFEITSTWLNIIQAELLKTPEQRTEEVEKEKEELQKKQEAVAAEKEKYKNSILPKLIDRIKKAAHISTTKDSIDRQIEKNEHLITAWNHIASRPEFDYTKIPELIITHFKLPCIESCQHYAESLVNNADFSKLAELRASGIIEILTDHKTLVSTSDESYKKLAEATEKLASYIESNLKNYDAIVKLTDELNGMTDAIPEVLDDFIKNKIVNNKDFETHINGAGEEARNHFMESLCTLWKQTADRLSEPDTSTDDHTELLNIISTAIQEQKGTEKMLEDLVQIHLIDKIKFLIKPDSIQAISILSSTGAMFEEDTVEKNNASFYAALKRLYKASAEQANPYQKFQLIFTYLSICINFANNPKIIQNIVPSAFSVDVLKDTISTLLQNIQVIQKLFFGSNSQELLNELADIFPSIIAKAINTLTNNQIYVNGENEEEKKKYMEALYSLWKKTAERLSNPETSTDSRAELLDTISTAIQEQKGSMEDLVQTHLIDKIKSLTRPEMINALSILSNADALFVESPENDEDTYFYTTLERLNKISMEQANRYQKLQLMLTYLAIHTHPTNDLQIIENIVPDNYSVETLKQTIFSLLHISDVTEKLLSNQKQSQEILKENIDNIYSVIRESGDQYFSSTMVDEEKETLKSSLMSNDSLYLIYVSQKLKELFNQLNQEQGQRKKETVNEVISLITAMISSGTEQPSRYQIAMANINDTVKESVKDTLAIMKIYWQHLAQTYLNPIGQELSPEQINLLQRVSLFLSENTDTKNEFNTLFKNSVLANFKAVLKIENFNSLLKMPNKLHKYLINSHQFIIRQSFANAQQKLDIWMTYLELCQYYSDKKENKAINLLNQQPIGGAAAIMKNMTPLLDKTYESSLSGENCRKELDIFVDQHISLLDSLLAKKNNLIINSDFAKIITKIIMNCSDMQSAFTAPNKSMVEKQSAQVKNDLFFHNAMDSLVKKCKIILAIGNSEEKIVLLTKLNDLFKEDSTLSPEYRQNLLSGITGSQDREKQKDYLLEEEKKIQPTKEEQTTQDIKNTHH